MSRQAGTPKDRKAIGDAVMQRFNEWLAATNSDMEHFLLATAPGSRGGEYFRARDGRLPGLVTEHFFELVEAWYPAINMDWLRAGKGTMLRAGCTMPTTHVTSAAQVEAEYGAPLATIFFYKDGNIAYRHPGCKMPFGIYKTTAGTLIHDPSIDPAKWFPQRAVAADQLLAENEQLKAENAGLKERIAIATKVLGLQ